MKRPLITKITNNTGSTLVLDTMSDHPRIVVEAHKSLKYPGDIFTVIPEKALDAALTISPSSFTIEYLVWNGKEYDALWLPLERTIIKAEPIITEPAKAPEKTPTVTVKETSKEEPVKVQEVAETISSEAPAVEKEETVTVEEAPAVDDFFTTTDTIEEEPKKTRKKGTRK